ncbi:hypothetical protein ACFL2D_03095 [Patescibacteria group bacterium]
MKVDVKTLTLAFQLQENEVTESIIYRRLARIAKSSKNRAILLQVSDEEKKHYNFLKKRITHQDVLPNMWKVRYHVIFSRLFGFSFGIRLMEKGEKMAPGAYEPLKKFVPDIEKVMEDERRHEQKMVGMLDSRVLEYAWYERCACRDFWCVGGFHIGAARYAFDRNDWNNHWSCCVAFDGLI